MRKGWSRWLSYLWIAFLVGLCIVGGTTLLIIPGIIFFAWFTFAQYLLADQDIKGTEALSESRELVRGYWWPVFGRILLIIILLLILYFFVENLLLFPIVFTFNPLIASGMGITVEYLTTQFLFLPLVIPFALVYFFVLYQDLKRPRENLLSKPKVAE